MTFALDSSSLSWARLIHFLYQIYHTSFVPDWPGIYCVRIHTDFLYQIHQHLLRQAYRACLCHIWHTSFAPDSSSISCFRLVMHLVREIRHTSFVPDWPCISCIRVDIQLLYKTHLANFVSDVICIYCSRLVIYIIQNGESNSRQKQLNLYPDSYNQL